jgi:hypothetical protein
LALNLDDKCLLIGGKVRKLTFGRQNWLYNGKWSAKRSQTKNPGNSFLREVFKVHKREKFFGSDFEFFTIL